VHLATGKFGQNQTFAGYRKPRTKRGLCKSETNQRQSYPKTENPADPGLLFRLASVISGPSSETDKLSERVPVVRGSGATPVFQLCVCAHCHYYDYACGEHRLGRDPSEPSCQARLYGDHKRHWNQAGASANRRADSYIEID